MKFILIVFLALFVLTSCHPRLLDNLCGDEFSEICEFERLDRKCGFKGCFPSEIPDNVETKPSYPDGNVKKVDYTPLTDLLKKIGEWFLQPQMDYTLGN